jgi:dTDP-4-dehydrorhamnose reductase
MGNNHKYIITGATGKIGTQLISGLDKGSFMVFTRSPQKLEKYIKKFVIDLAKIDIKEEFPEYDTVIHLAAETHIEKCEEDRSKGEKGSGWINNVVVTRNLAKYCATNHKKLIMLSTECVFGGRKTKYSENDKPAPKSWYGVTKMEAENMVKQNLTNFIILRTVMAYGGKGGRMDLPQLIMNSLKNNAEITLSTDQKIAFTYTGDIVKAILSSSEKGMKGIYHFCGPDVLTPFELGLLIAKKYHFNKNLLIPKTLRQMNGPESARLRLKNAVLSNKKFINDIGRFSYTGINQGLSLLRGDHEKYEKTN